MTVCVVELLISLCGFISFIIYTYDYKSQTQLNYICSILKVHFIENWKNVAAYHSPLEHFSRLCKNILK